MEGALIRANSWVGRHRARRVRRLGHPQGGMAGWGRGWTAGVGWKARQGRQGLDEGLGRAAGRKGDQYNQLRLFGPLPYKDRWVPELIRDEPEVRPRTRAEVRIPAWQGKIANPRMSPRQAKSVGESHAFSFCWDVGRGERIATPPVLRVCHTL